MARLELTFLERTPIEALLSQIVFAFVLIGLYRMLLFYLREHRVSAALMVEITIVGVPRDPAWHGGHRLAAAGPRRAAGSLEAGVLRPDGDGPNFRRPLTARRSVLHPLEGSKSAPWSAR